MIAMEFNKWNKVYVFEILCCHLLHTNMDRVWGDSWDSSYWCEYDDFVEYCLRHKLNRILLHIPNTYISIT